MPAADPCHVPCHGHQSSGTMSSKLDVFIKLPLAIVFCYCNRKKKIRHCSHIGTDIQTQLLLFHILKLLLVLYRALPCLHFHLLRIVCKTTFSRLQVSTKIYVYSIFASFLWGHVQQRGFLQLAIPAVSQLRLQLSSPHHCNQMVWFLFFYDVYLYSAYIYNIATKHMVLFWKTLHFFPL